MTRGHGPHLLIFDCDGVLADTESHLQAVDLRLIAELGWPITVEEIHTEHLGRSTVDVVASIERHLGRRVPDDFTARRRSAFKASITAGLSPVPGVEAAVRALLSVGYRICVASSGSPEAIADSLARTALAPLFGANVFSSYRVTNGKPAPDLFRYAADAMDTAAARCIVIEDSPAGGVCRPRCGNAGRRLRSHDTCPPSRACRLDNPAHASSPRRDPPPRRKRMTSAAAATRRAFTQHVWSSQRNPLQTPSGALSQSSALSIKVVPYDAPSTDGCPDGIVD